METSSKNCEAQIIATVKSQFQLQVKFKKAVFVWHMLQTAKLTQLSTNSLNTYK